ncbi:MAG TPA: VOC family protein [Blastocatellia bacterium]|nr:VOC family protein [Blastocatellia bacterium]
MAVKPIPEGYHTVTPYLVVEGAAKLIDFLKAAFGAQEVFRMPGKDGTVGHAEVRIGDSMIMLADAQAGYPARPSMICLYVEDVDATYQRALEAGATVVRELADQFYGDRSGGVQDASGMQWWISTHIEDVPPEELARREAALKEQHQEQCG